MSNFCCSLLVMIVVVGKCIIPDLSHTEECNTLRTHLYWVERVVEEESPKSRLPVLDAPGL